MDNTGFVVAVLDCNGVVVGLLNKVVDNIRDLTLMKLLCIKEALNWVKLYYNRDVIIESDSLIAILDLNKMVDDRTYIFDVLLLIVIAIKTILVSMFSIFSKDMKMWLILLLRAPIL